jgi:hypothetical protein
MILPFWRLWLLVLGTGRKKEGLVGKESVNDDR